MEEEEEVGELLGASSSPFSSSARRLTYRRPRSELEGGHSGAAHQQQQQHRRQEEEEQDIIQWFFGNRVHPSETDYTSFQRLSFRDKVRTLIWVHKTRLLGHYKIFHHYIERCPCRPSSPLSRSYARSYSRALTDIGPRPCLRAPLTMIGLQGLYIRTPPSADAWRNALNGIPPTAAPNAYLIEIFRLQPFAAAAYLRSLLYCWIGGVMLQLEAAASFGTGSDTFYERTAWHWLCLQLTLQLLQAPARLKLWRRLVSVSHSQEADEASERIRRLVTSHLWLFSQALGTLFHIVAAFGPFFLYLIDPASPVRRTVLSVCCANLLIFILRTILTFVIMHSILEARNGNGAGGNGAKIKRGLSHNSILKLKRRESNAENTSMCSICITQFEEGENLLLLPCDERHAFHEECITQWLVRNSNCPLCMGEVVAKTPTSGGVGEKPPAILGTTGSTNASTERILPSSR